MLPIKGSYKVSKNKGKLYFDDQPAGPVDYFENGFGNYKLEARVLYNKGHELPWVFSIHGARADFTKSDAVSIGLQARGFSLLGFNLSGHSPAGAVPLEQTSLANNITEALQFYRFLDAKHPKAVIAYSLGGTPALKVLAEHSDEIDKLVLFYPGIYSKLSYDKHFGEEFRKVISQPFSYQQNDTINVLRQFKGKLLLIKGQYDGLDPADYGKPAGTSVGEIEVKGKQYYSPIPKDIIDEIIAAVPKDRRHIITIPDCDHSVVLWMREHPRQAADLLQTIAKFLKSQD